MGGKGMAQCLNNFITVAAIIYLARAISYFKK
ncbi:hypothetical protein UFOVP204_143 [uncultured Caudovirales phage]|uniref:Uncharacterized protein n=1 Tax=uncultured Caudovirales phage TaxID=2100421 RepID=A0A6J7WJU2_9CAUD|nr:hypothetical protein UFOVP204_143 [uncultured Caudovirales phage]